MIDTEAQRRRRRPRPRRRRSEAGAAAHAARRPAAQAAAGDRRERSACRLPAKMHGGEQLAPADVAGTGRDGRVTKGDVLAATQARRQPRAPAPQPRRAPRRSAPQAALPQVARAGRRPTLGDRPEQRVPMSRLRARIAERLLQSQSTDAILTTFNEVNMAPVMELRNRYKDRFEKEHGVQLAVMLATRARISVIA